MAWIELKDTQGLHTLIRDSNDLPQIIFKHSTRCSLSSLALNRLNDTAKSNNIFVVNVIEDRTISNEVVEKTRVMHESPQLLVVYKEACIYSASHLQISGKDLNLALKGLELH